MGFLRIGGYIVFNLNSSNHFILSASKFHVGINNYSILLLEYRPKAIFQEETKIHFTLLNMEIIHE
jgi:hypothetical protein